MLCQTGTTIPEQSRGVGGLQHHLSAAHNAVPTFLPRQFHTNLHLNSRDSRLSRLPCDLDNFCDLTLHQCEPTKRFKCLGTLSLSVEQMKPLGWVLEHLQDQEAANPDACSTSGPPYIF